MTPTRRRGRKPVAGQEERLLGLLRQAEGHAYALAHSYDIGGQPDRAYAFVALGERLRNTVMDVSDIARPFEPHSVAPLLGLRSRAFSLRRLMRGTSSECPSVAPIVSRLGGEQRLTGAANPKAGTKGVPASLNRAEHSA